MSSSIHAHLRPTSVAVVATLTLLFAMPSACDASVEKSLTDTAKLIAQELQQQQIGKVKIKVEDLDVISSSLPNTIREVIVRELKTFDISIATIAADRTLKIVPQLDNDDPDRTAMIRVEFSLLDKRGKVLVALRADCRINAPNDIVQGLGLTADNSDKRTGQSRPVGPLDHKQQLPGGGEDSGKKPHIGGSVVRGNANGMFGVEILRSGQAVKPMLADEKYAYCEINENESYEVRLINDAPFDVLVSLTIDGVDSGWFTPSKRVLWYVRKGDSSTIKGWLTKTGDQGTGAKFEVGPHDESVAATLGKVGDLGVVQACFFRSYMKDEQRDPGDKGGTRFGESFPWKVHRIERFPGKHLRAAIAVRYSKN